MLTKGNKVEVVFPAKARSSQMNRTATFSSPWMRNRDDTVIRLFDSRKQRDH